MVQQKAYTGWEILKESFTGTGQQSGKRQIIATATKKTKREEAPNVNILEDRDVAAELKRSSLRWSIYKLPVCQVITEE